MTSTPAMLHVVHFIYTTESRRAPTIKILAEFAVLVMKEYILPMIIYNKKLIPHPSYFYELYNLPIFMSKHYDPVY